MIKIDIFKEINNDMSLDINLEIKDREFLALSGDSGSGKTTLLRILAGLEEAKGEIIINDEVWLSKDINLPPQKRNIGFIFQDYALFENMSILQNLLYVQKDIDLANRLLKMTKLENLKNRLPKNLSGGQKQRVALCRAMMKRPKLLLLDEPLSAIDTKLRTSLQDEILKLHQEFKTTSIITSHDLAEIYKMSDRVVVIDRGKVIKNGTKDILVDKRYKVENIKKIGDIYVGSVNIDGVLREVEWEDLS